MAKAGYHHGELREALLDSAEALVGRVGAEGWSLREISAQVGVSPSAAYHHFASRDALVRALSTRVLVRLGERMSDAAAHAAESSADGQEELVAVGRTYVRWALEDPAVARLAFGVGSRGADTEVHPHPHDVIDAQLDKLVDAGTLPTAVRPGAAFAVWAAVHGLAALLADGLMTVDSPQAADQLTERLVRAVLSGLTQELTPRHGWPEAQSLHTKRRGN